MKLELVNQTFHSSFEFQEPGNGRVAIIKAGLGPLAYNFYIRSRRAYLIDIYHNLDGTVVTFSTTAFRRSR